MGDSGREVPEAQDSVDVLLVEDSLLQATVFEDILMHSGVARFVVQRRTTLIDALQAMSGTRFDVILLDLNLPDSMGLDTFYVVKKNAGDVPVLILTRIEDEQMAIEAVRSGAQDYLVKRELDPHVLGRVIQCVIERDRLNKMRGEIVNSVAHEIRTPLTIIKCAVDNIVDGIAGPVDDGMGKMMRIIKNNVDRLAKVVKGIFAFKALESQCQSRREPVDLAKIVHMEVEKLHGDAEQKHVIIREVASPQLPELLGDAAMLTEVVNYILDNALRFASKAVDIRITKHPGYVQVSVTDDGPGLPADKLKQLFQTFTQFNRPHGGPGYKGIGLGLVVCKEIIRCHDGRIWAERGSKGLIVNFTLPTPKPRQVAKGNKGVGHGKKTEKSAHH